MAHSPGGPSATPGLFRHPPPNCLMIFAAVVVIEIIIRGAEYFTFKKYYNEKDRMVKQGTKKTLHTSKTSEITRWLTLPGGTPNEPRSRTDSIIGPPRILHVVWGRPLPDDKGYGFKERVLDSSTFTGCCDNLIEVALKSYTTMLPKDFRILLWSIGGWNHVGYLKHIGLDNANIHPMVLDPHVELADDPNLVQVYESLRSVVPRSDFVRYVLMRNYGGSYVDLDGIMVGPLPYDGTPRVNLSPTERTSEKDGLNCEGEGYTREPGTCVMSNGMFVGFPANHTFFQILLSEISSTNRTCGGHYFFCYSPGWMTNTLKNELNSSDIAKIEVRVEPLLRNGGSYQYEKNVIISHWDFDDGDITCDHNKVMSELCQKFNISYPIGETPTKQQKNDDAIAKRKYTHPGCDACKRLDQFGSLKSKGMLVFTHIPQTAGKAIENIIGFVASCHVTSFALSECNETRYDSAVSFAVISHPMDHILSLYRYARGGGNGAQYDLGKFAWVKNATIDEFVLGLDASDYYYAPMSYFIGSMRLGVKKVLCQDNLANDWEEMMRLIPPDLKPEKNPTEVLAGESMNDSIVPLTLNRTSFERIRSVYGDDFMLWGRYCGGREPQHRFVQSS